MSSLQQYWNTDIGPWLWMHGLRILIVIAGGWLLNMVLKRFIVRVVRISVIRDNHDSAEAEKKREDTLIRIFTWSAAVIIVIMIIMMVLQEVGVPIGPMLAGAGIVGLAFGFGGQYLIRDFISGFFMILENQYRIGDVVHLDETEGVVEDISLRMTTLRDMNGTVHHVPHGDIKRVSNHSKNFARINLNINVTYTTELDKVIKVLNDVGSQMSEETYWKELILKTPKFLRVDNFGESAISLKVVGETMPNKQWEVTGELRKRIKQAFDKEGIDIPIPQRVIHHKDGNRRDSDV